MSVFATALTTILTLGALPACLDVKRGAANPDTTDTSDATDTTNPGDTTNTLDTSPDTLDPDTAPLVPDASDPCANIDCDDQNECTIDVCSGGLCTYTPLVGGALPDPDPAEPPECLDDSGCDDNDPCTIDSCLVRPGLCGGIAWGSCTHVRDPAVCPETACTADQRALCKDGDPCTLDGCDVDFGCSSTPIGEGLCDSHCSVDQVIALPDVAHWRNVGDALTTRGTIDMAPTDCPDCEECSCTGAAQLTDLGVGLVLLGDEGPTCTSRGGAPVCTSLVFDVSYLAWGTAAYEARETDPSGGVVDLAPNALDLGGYCLDTASDTIAAIYDATFSIEGVKTATFTATLLFTSRDELVMIISDAATDPATSTPVDVAAFAVQAPVVTRDDEGRLNFGLDIPWLGFNVERENVYLFSRENTLVGSLGPLFHSATSPDDKAPAPPAPPAEDTLPYGDLRLVRRTP